MSARPLLSEISKVGNYKKKQDHWSEFVALLPKIIEDHSLCDVIGALINSLRETCSGSRKDDMLAINALEAVKGCVDLPFHETHSTFKKRYAALESFKNDTNKIELGG